MAVVSFWILQTIFIGAFICQPIELNWDPGVRGSCGNENAAFVSVAAVDILTDLYLLLLPLKPLLSLQIDRTQKIALATIFTGGFVTLIVTAVRLYLLFAVNFNDLSFSVTTSTYLTIIQPGIAMMVACSPHLKPILDLFSASRKSRATNPSDNSAASNAISSTSRPTRTGRLNKRGFPWPSISGFDRISESEQPSDIELGVSSAHETRVAANRQSESGDTLLPTTADEGITITRQTIVSSSPRQLMIVIEGLLGRYYSVRHSLGQYRSVCVAATYSVSPFGNLNTKQGFRDAFENSLQATINVHPGLCYGLADQVDDSLQLYRQVEVTRREDVVKYAEIGELDAGRSHEDLFHREIETAHAELWTANKPAWKTVVLIYSDERLTANPDNGNQADYDKFCWTIHVAFLFHHAIADGLSGLAFHKTLMQSFEAAPGDGQRPQWPLFLLDARPAPPSMDDLIDFIPPTMYHAREDASERVWGGSVVTLSSIDGFESRLRVITFTHQEFSEVLRTCRKLEVTVTNLLHGVICTTLARALAGDEGIRAATPYSLRKFTGAAPQAILNHISFATKYVPSSLLRALRQSAPHSPEEHRLLVELARDFGKDMRAELERFPKGNVWGEISGIEDLAAHCRSQMGKAREYTYELSNLGASTGGPFPSVNSSPKITLEKLLFTQNGTVTGQALGFNCASVVGGPFTIGITWQEGIVEETLVDTISCNVFVNGESHAARATVEARRSLIIARAISAEEILERRLLYANQGGWNLDKIRIYAAVSAVGMMVSAYHD
ncbi:hypothetical protein NUW58_g5243 [Xylaria curta]|uniref:Uncharacterized protein n=1 Tax=Xylaria curta TaxID=42375 RepID=A0ACC1P2J0_9PEZI|nr:hypothetical protein NUW58_g5243 [Xylaria curta]